MPVQLYSSFYDMFFFSLYFNQSWRGELICNNLCYFLLCFQLVYNVEATTVKEISRKIGDQRKIESYIQIRPLKVNFHFDMLPFSHLCLSLYDNLFCGQGRSSDTSTSDSVSDADDSCSPTRGSSSSILRLAPVDEEVSSPKHNIVFVCFIQLQ